MVSHLSNCLFHPLCPRLSKANHLPRKIWQSDDGRHLVRDGHVYLLTNQNAKPVELHLTQHMSALEIILLKLLNEAVDDFLRKS